MVPEIFKPLQSRTRNLSTGEFFKKCAQRHHAIHVSNFRAASRKYTSHFGQISPVLVKKSLKRFVVRRELYFEIWQPAHFTLLVINSKHSSVKRVVSNTCFDLGIYFEFYYNFKFIDIKVFGEVVLIFKCTWLRYEWKIKIVPRKSDKLRSESPQVAVPPTDTSPNWHFSKLALAKG